MNEFDKTIFGYRKEKEEVLSELCLKERIHGNYKKVTYPSTGSGYVDGYIYYPKDALDKYPVVFNFHGGGMVLGFCELDGPYCREIADITKCAVVNVDYPLAPEFKYPIPMEASYEFINQVLEDKTLKLDRTSVFLMGHSAGGYISCCLAYLMKDKLKGFISNYGLFSQGAKEIKDAAKAISSERMTQYFHWYFNDASRIHEPLASPMNMDVNGFPPSLIIEAEFDSLCAEEQAFASKLRDANVPVQEAFFRECQHGFTHAHLKEYRKEDSKKAWISIQEFIHKYL